MALRIYGAGMAGLMAAQMMRRHQPFVHEAQLKLPDNHGALLRFRSNAVGKAVGQRLTRVEVQKAVMSGGSLRDSSTLADANAYSLKVSGEAMGRSILNLTGGERYIAPDDFLEAMARGVDITYDSRLTEEEVRKREPDSDPIISTIPMPALAAMVGGSEGINFKFKPVWSARSIIRIPTVRLCQTIYYPGIEQFYRASITGQQLILEYTEEPRDVDADMREVLGHFGIWPLMGIAWETPDVKLQKFGKLLPIPEEERQRFILAMSDRYNIYSLGRFATWRQILLDDVAHDVEVIENFISQRSSFSRRRHYNG
jgi:hypothetical protein